MDGKMKSLPQVSGKRGRGFIFWISYVVLLRASLARIERFFEALGRKVASNPKKTVLFAVLCVTLSGLGLLRLNKEMRSAKLFTPSRSESELALEEGQRFFRNSLNSRTEEIIFLPKNGSNVLCIECLKEAAKVIQIAQNITGYKILCKKRPKFLNSGRRLFRNGETCSIMNPIEILTGREGKATIYRKFKRALSTTSILMSNGRAAVYNFKSGLAGFRFNESNGTPFARALRVEIYLQQGLNETHLNQITQWERSFLQAIQGVANECQHVSIMFAAERSLDDAINDSSSKDISLISMTFAMMITFACLMLTKFINPVRGHTWLAMSGVLSTGLGILAGIGVSVLLGVPFISLVGVVPFLVVSIGIDDMFIIVDEFDRQSKQNVPTNRVAFALSKVGATITMTTVTDIIAFLASATSAFPAIRYFCIYTAMCIGIEFLLQITLFVALLSFDSRRIFANRNDCCPCVRVPDRTCCKLPNQFSWSQKFMRSYGQILLTKKGKTLVCLCTLGLFAFGMYGSININNEFSRKTLAVPGSSYANYLDTFESNFPQTVPVSIQITGRVNYSDPIVRKQINNLASIAHRTGYYLSQNLTWTLYFDDFIKQFQIDANGKHFKKAIELFLAVPVYSQHNVDIIRDKNGMIVASRVVVFLKDNAKSTFQKDAMLTLREDLKKYSPLTCTTAANPFIYFEQYAIVTKEVRNNLLFISCVISIMLIPFCIHPLVIIFVVLGFFLLVIELFGLMYFWGISLNAISMINIVMSVGFTVDYSAHIAHSFITSTAQTVNGRIVDALATVGGSVLMGGISTFLGMSLTGLAQTAIFQIFFKMFLGIILFGLYNGFVLLPVLMSVFSRYLCFHNNAIPSDIELLSPMRMIRNLFNKVFRGKGQQVETPSISIVGISTRFPTASNKSQFKDLLERCGNTTTEYPEDRHARKRFFEDSYHPSRPVAGKLYVSNGSYLENIDRFDHQFFGISATEAKSMDPQQRMLLQGVYEATEDAGVTLDEIQQCTTGVYVGIMNLDYSSIVLRDDTILKIDQFASTGTAFSIAANRISFSLNLTGPSVAIDTACSSSMTALSLACDHLEKRIVDVAIVAAANLILCPRKQTTICRANMLAPDGKCKVFDERADGYGRGEAIIALVLKSSDLVHIRDKSYAEIIGWGINNDGQSAAPITAPSADLQRDLMINVLQQARVDPKQLHFVEMHGTGTIIGDMVETKSVGEVYGKARGQNNPMMIGSVKSNVNHTESSAGLAGLAKLCLMIENDKIFPTVGIENQAIRLDIEERGLRIPTKIEEWPSKKGETKMAAVNSFGYGGSNAHLILREPTKARTFQMVDKVSKQEDDGRSLRLIILSARSLTGLIDSAKVFSEWMRSLDDNKENLTSVCYTINERRTIHNVRLTVASESLEGFSDLLNVFAGDSDKKNAGFSVGRTKKFGSSVAFIFGGQGSQWLGMAGDLIREPRILRELKRINKLAKKNGHKRCLLAYLAPENETTDHQDCLVTVQLSIFALQYAVSKFLTKTASIEPLAVGGHSLGDITAACIAGILTPNKAVKIILARASLQDKCKSEGTMAAIGLSVKEVTSILNQLSVEDQICIAAENDKNSITISGDKDAIEKVDEYIKENRKDVFWRKLATHKAFHSHHMDSIKDEFIQRIAEARIKHRNATSLFVSTTEGRHLDAREIDTEYWWRNLRNPVQFNECIKQVLSRGIRVFIEISPRPVLSHYIDAIAKQADIEDTSIIQALPARKEPERLKHLYARCIGNMYTIGYPISMNKIQDQEKGRFLRYPSYPWQETDLWAQDEYRIPEKTMHLIGIPTYVGSKRLIWKNEIDLHRFKFLNDHVMKSSGVILPGACYVELALEATIRRNNTEAAIVRNLRFLNVLPLHDHLVRTVECIKEELPDDKLSEFKIVHVADQGDVTISSASLLSFESKGNETILTLSEAMSTNIDWKDSLDKKRPESSPPSESGSSYGITDDGLDLQFDVGANSGSSKESKSSSTSINDDEKQVVDSHYAPNDDVLLTALNFDQEYNELDAEAFTELAGKSGFQFGECFSLIEYAWSAENRALVRIKMPKSVYEELSLYVIHPCIIDASLQSCIAIGSTDPNRNVIPIGIDSVRLNPIRRQFKHLYAYAEVASTAVDTCDVKLLDDCANVILLIQGFRVKEVSLSQRMPSIETSLYEMNWHPTVPKDDTEDLSDYNKVVIISFKTMPALTSVMNVLTEVGVSKDCIDLYHISGGGDIADFGEELVQKLNPRDSDNKKALVINLLPLAVNMFTIEEDLSMTANWLSFESTLEALKVLSKNEMDGSKLIAFTCQSFGSEVHPDRSYSVPWAATVLGMARAANLETEIPLIPIDFGTALSDEEVKKALQSLNLRSVEEGLVISPSEVYQPLLQRVKMEESKLRVSQGITLKQGTSFYLSWVPSESKYCVKRGLQGMRSIPNNYVEVDIKYVSSPVGSSVLLLDNIKSPQSKSLLQCAHGVVVHPGAEGGGFKIDDEVVTVYNSRWVRSRMLIPSRMIIKKPQDLSPKLATIAIGHMALAYNAISKILASSSSVRKVFINSTACNRGFSLILGEIAKWKGLDVVYEDEVSEKKDKEGSKMAKIADHHMRGSNEYSQSFDCVIFSSNIHPADQIALVDALKRGGIAMILDNGSKSSLASCEITKTVTVLNFKLREADLAANEFSSAMCCILADEVLCKTMQAIQNHETFSLSDICGSLDTHKADEEPSAFDCISLELPQGADIHCYPSSMDVQGLKEDRSYIVIGGSKGLGFNTVAWMVSRGAGTVIPVGRSDLTEKTADDFRKLEAAYGSRIKFIKADASTMEGIEVISNELQQLPRLAGIVNSGAVLDDKLFQDVDRENYRKVMAPKMHGTMYLDDMLKKEDDIIDLFVLYSSITSVLGNNGQTVYAAANAFMNSFAHYRASVQGKPCLSVCWGAMGGSGMLARNTNVATLLEKSGLHLLDIPTGLQWMDKVLTSMPQRSNICICDVDWRTFLNSLPVRKANSIVYDEIRKEIPNADKGGENILDMILNERSNERRLEIITTYIKEWIAAWISGSAEEVDCNVSLFTYGIDSVGATALKGQIEKDLQINFQVFYFMQPETTITKLADDLLKAIYDKFIKTNEEEEEDEQKDAEDEPLLQEQEDDEDKLVLPEDYLTTIYKPGGTQANLFLVHPSHRYSGCFSAFAIGMTYQKVFSLYAFGSQDMAYMGEDIGSVTRIAKACINLMLEVQPCGPYFLGGYSFGGLVSLEMASMLEEAGQKVALVVMIDTVRWIPNGRDNAKLLIDTFDETFETEAHIKEQMNGFLRKIATKQLGLPLEEYENKTKEMSLTEIEEYLSQRGEEAGKGIPDIKKTMQSIVNDQAMAARCHNEWLPPANLYQGDVMYVQAADDKFCRKIKGVGSSVDCWSSILLNKITTATCSGDHYSMMDSRRGRDVGKVVTVAALLKFRSLFPNRYRIVMNGCHKQSLMALKQSGLKVVFIKKTAQFTRAVAGVIKLSKSEKKLKFIPDSTVETKLKLRLKDVKNITQLDIHDPNRDHKVRGLEKFSLYAGLCLMTNKHNKFRIMHFNGQDYRRFVSTLEAAYGIKLPF